jgi:opacity protein-like surface antigen
MKLSVRILPLLVSIFLLATTLVAWAQPNKKQKAGFRSGRDPFLNTQWWVGIKAGGNVSRAKAVERYSTFNSMVDPSGNLYNKNYESFKHPAGQAGLEITFYHKGFSLSFQPNYRRMTFGYKNEYLWEDATVDYSFAQQYTSVHKLDYFELPLLVRYEPFKTRLRPFVQAGVYYARLNNAFKSTQITVTDRAGGAANEYTEAPIEVGAKELFIRSNIGWIAGAGVSYPLGNVRLALDIAYRHNTNNITNAANRYENDRLTGSGDIMDDVKLRNVSVSMSCLIPLRFIMKGKFRAE